MRSATWIRGKWYAFRELLRMVRWLSNWREVWSCYRAGRSGPALRFRSGVILQHGPGDDPILHLHEVFIRGHYRRHVDHQVDGVLVDLGANIGAVALDWARRRPGIEIHAYEPNPATNRMLRANVVANALSSRITVHDEFVGSAGGDRTLWTNPSSVLSTGYRTDRLDAASTAIRVRAIDLNEVVKRADRPVALLKIDTEGAEADILDGATTETLARVRQVVLEYHNQLCPDALDRCRRVLSRAGFSCRVHHANADQGLLYARRALS